MRKLYVKKNDLDYLTKMKEQRFEKKQRANTILFKSNLNSNALEIAEVDFRTVSKERPKQQKTQNSFVFRGHIVKEKGDKYSKHIEQSCLKEITNLFKILSDYIEDGKLIF